MSITLSALQKQRRDTAANWTAENPTLLAGEIGLESDTGYWKVGDGVTAWTSLAYVSGLGAEIPVDRLADGAARQLLQTDAAGTGVEWTDDIDVPGTLDVTGAATFDDDVTIQGDLTVNGTTTTIDTTTLVVEDKNIEIGKVATPTDVTADGGGITLKGSTDKTINWIDATNAWTSSERFSYPLGSAADPALTFTGDPNTGIYSPGADQVAISTNGTGRLFVDASGNIKITSNQYQALSHKLFGYSGSYGAIVVGAGGDNYGNISLGVDLSAISGGGFNGQNQVIFPATGGLIPDNAGNNFVGFYHRNSSDSLVLGPATVGGITSGPLTITSTSVGLGTSTFGNADADDLTVAGSGNTGITIRSGTTSAANLYFADGTTGDDAVRGYLAYNHSTDKLTIGANAATAVTIDSSQRVGIGTAVPLRDLHVSNGGAEGYEFGPGESANINQTLHYNRSTSAYIENNNRASAHSWDINTSEAVRIDTSGRLLVGTSTARSNVNVGSYTGLTPFTQINTAVNSYSNGMTLLNYSGSGFGPVLSLGTSKSNTLGTNAILSATDDCGRISFNGNDGTNFLVAAEIAVQVDGTPGANDMPGRLVFSTTADGASSPTRRMTIKQDGSFVFGDFDSVGSTASGGKAYIEGNSTLYVAVGGGTVAYFNRNTNDGEIVALRQANITEGAISVSGSTVTYGGGHLARWSQLPNDEDPSEILKGTVMSNLDAMCEWGEEDNEQLNKTKVSDVEGDSNVAGVFVSTSFSEEGPLDFFVGMTGDMIIRIAEGVTVQRGDLLMSAGDGTAKPQDDDIVRSKTVAKVTSTHVTCTYDDGSYCVPCVLMAC